MKLPTNRERTDWARIAIDAYSETVHGEEEERGRLLSYLLCDLMHFCDVERIHWNRCVARAQDHYREEIAEERRLDAAVKAVVNCQ